MEKAVGSLDKMVYSLRERLSNYFPTDDLDISDELIEDSLLDGRATVIRDAWKEKRMIDNIYYTEYKGLEIKVKRYNDIDPPELYSDIPVLIDKLPNNGILFIGTNDRRKAYEIVSMMNFNSTKGRQFTSEEPVVTIIGNKIYYKNTDITQKYARFIAVFYDPREVPSFDGVLVPPTMIKKVEYLSFNDLIASYNIPKDIKDDAADITGVQRQVAPVRQNK